MSSQLSQSFCIRFPVATPCYFHWKVLGLTWVGIDLLIESGKKSRNNGSFFLRILSTQKTIWLYVYKLGCLILHAGIEIKHIRSHSTFFGPVFGLVSGPAYASTSKYYLFTIYITGQKSRGLFPTHPLL